MVNMNGHNRAVMVWLFIMTLFAVAPSAMAAVSASVDRHTIAEGETFNLTIESSDRQSGEPDTSPLEQDFEVLSRNHSSSYSIINGSMQSRSSWQLVLRPRKTGTLVIPPVTVGKAQTAAISIEVNRAETRNQPGGEPHGDLWVEMSVKPEHIRVRQQAMITIRVYQGISLTQAQLTEPEVKQAVIERLGEDSQYQQSRSGRTWEVTERKYALFPQQSGTIELAPVQLDAVTIAGAQNGFSPFFQSTRPLQIRSNSLTLKVEPVPAGWQGSEWLPASRMTLTEAWPEGKVFKAGEPITRTLTLKADGLTSSQLPALPDQLPDNLKAYPDQPALSDQKGEDGIEGVRSEKVAMMPTQPGTYILPAIAIPWWNVTTGRMETAELPARTFKVEGALAAPAAAQTPVPTSVQAKQPELQQQQETAEPVHVVSDAGWWKPVAIISSSGWLLTLLWGAYRMRRPARLMAEEKAQRPDCRQARKAVVEACRHHDARACEQALLHFVAARWPDDAVGMRRLTVAEDALANQIRRLQKHLYGYNQGAWQGDELLHAFEQFEVDSNKTMVGRTDKPLPPLYPN